MIAREELKAIEAIKQALIAAIGDYSPLVQVVGEAGEGGPGTMVVLGIGGGKQPAVSRRWRRTARFSVTYAPEAASPTPNSDCLAAAEWLYGKLGEVESGGLFYRGIDLHDEIADGQLVFYVSFEGNYAEAGELAPLMGVLRQAGQPK